MNQNFKLTRNLRTASTVCAAAMAFLMGAVAPAAAEPDEVLLAARGAGLIEEKCSRCHATGMTDQSTHRDAPPFREVVTRYPVETLAEALGEGIITGHPDMPFFVFEPDEIDAILAYLATLQDPQEP